MKRTIRMLAAPAAALLILAGCGSGDDQAADEPTTAEEIPAEETDDEAAEDESDSWPIVEDEDGNVEENPEGAPMDGYEEGDVTDEAGNLIATEFGDGETIEFDMEAATGEQPMIPGVRVYGMSENGGDFIITTKVDPVEDLESYREKAGAEPVTYMSADIDNRDGIENINMYQVAVYDEAGNEYIFTSADDAADEWRDLLGSDDTDTYNEGIELSNKYLNQGASPHQRSMMILTGPELPTEFTAVVAMPRGAYEVAATIPLKG